MATTRQPSLLLVDDEDNILSALKRLLRNEGYRIHTCNDPVRALELIDDLVGGGEPVDVVLSDQRMPTMSGTEFLRRVKQSHPNTVRLVLSGYTELQSITDAINEGAIYKFLTKPWEDENLKANLQEAFQHQAMKSENQRLTLELASANRQLTVANEELRHLLEEKKLHTQMLEASLDTSQKIIQLIPWPIIGVDADGMIVLANSAAEQQFNQCDSLLGLPAADYLPDALALELQNPLVPPNSIQFDYCQHCQHCQFQIVCRSMGADSRSHGKLLALLPKEALR